MKLEWDKAKNRLNQIKHGVSFEQAAEVFEDPKRIYIRIPGMGRDESRWQCVGWDGEGILTVRFTLRRGAIRVIGAGYWRRQRKIYEQENQIQ
jgi:uncharacterized protein